MPIGFTQLERDQIHIPGEGGISHTMTPYFRYENVYNETQSRLAGKPVYELKEMVEIRFAANSNYRPVFGVNEQQHCDDDGRITTWAEYFKPQYQTFVAGATQEASGTPLEELLPYGMSQAQLSMCRALDIYSIEAMHHLEGPALKRLGPIGNELKPMARRFLEAKAASGGAQAQIDELRAQLAEREATQAIGAAMVGIAAPAPDDALLDLVDDDGLRGMIARLSGTRPRKNVSRPALLRKLAVLREPKAPVGMGDAALEEAYRAGQPGYGSDLAAFDADAMMDAGDRDEAA